MAQIELPLFDVKVLNFSLVTERDRTDKGLVVIEKAKARTIFCFSIYGKNEEASIVIYHHTNNAC